MSSLRFRLLGPVTLVADGKKVELGPVKRRTVLAALLVNPCRPVSLETLTEWVWPDPPLAASSVLYSHISHLRRVLLSTAERARVPIELARRSGGYQLDVADNLVDARVFQRQLAHAAGERDELGTDILRQALDLWHGNALADIPGGRAARVRLAWQQQMLSATAIWARQETRAGRPDSVIERLMALLADYPHVESLGTELMRAMVATGRHSQALELYAMIRECLVDNLGIEPGAELRGMHMTILRGASLR